MNHVVVITKMVNFIRAQSLNHRQFVSLLEENETEHRDISYHTVVRWLSLGKLLKDLWDLREEIWEFCVKKVNVIPQLSAADWLADLGIQLQCEDLFVHEMYSTVTAFIRKFSASLKPYAIFSLTCQH